MDRFFDLLAYLPERLLSLWALLFLVSFLGLVYCAIFTGDGSTQVFLAALVLFLCTPAILLAGCLFLTIVKPERGR